MEEFDERAKQLEMACYYIELLNDKKTYCIINNKGVKFKSNRYTDIPDKLWEWKFVRDDKGWSV